MHNNQEWEYQDADLDHDISERSKLYSLKPIGIGTSNVESLSSYICRLAEAHCLDVKKFIKRIIFPNMKMLTFKYDRLLTRNFYAQNMRTENRTFWMPHEIAVTLEELTQQNNLTSLTLSKWRYVIGNRYSHKAYLAWCPICFNEWENKNRPIYQPLLWTLREVNYCPHHKVKLQSKCPNKECGHMISHIETKMKLGYCPKCYTWLGYNTENYPKRISESDQWVIKTIEDWIISTSQLTVSPENSCIKKLISSYVHSNYDESFTGLAAKIGISRSNLGLLTYRGDKIRLSVALNICKYFEIPLSQLLNERYEQELTEGMKKNQFIDKNLVKKRLLKILTKENPPLSLSKTVEELGYWPKTLTKYLPSICSKIVKRYEDYVIENEKYYPGEAFINLEARKQENELLDERYEKVLTRDIKKNQYMDKNLVEKKLIKILTKPNPPLSLNKTAKELGHQPKTLTRYFPSICSKIVKRYKDYVIKNGKYYPSEEFIYFKTRRQKLDANNSPN